MRRIICFIVIAGLLGISSTRSFAMTYLFASPSGSGSGTSIGSPASLADIKVLAQTLCGHGECD